MDDVFARPMEDDDDDGKRAKSSVEYGKGNADGDMCGRCEYFCSPGSNESKCKCVKGTVEARMWCVLYEVRDQNKQWS